jgi:hypothetical protein
MLRIAAAMKAAIGFALVLLVGLGIAAATIGSGIFLLVQRATGTRAVATVTDCVTTGSARSRRTDCTGTWIAGGPLTQGGHVVVGTVQGAEQSDVGKKVDVTLRGDTAYVRDLTLPLILIGLGLVPATAVVNVIIRKTRSRGGRGATAG